MIEIERKFLVTGDNWRHGASVARIEQAYLPGAGDVSVRVRVRDGAATLAVKGDRAGISRQEYEYAIPL
ncbi:CYTH domain-containing protein, partial [Acinetobacter baumannii]|uniref:CYTH domain-containing protein n=1 Tax=Acinetobacter baumannii TaxID=470 RepID=UPI001C09E087